MAGKFREWLKGIGGGGEGFMGKFGTGQGSISQAFKPMKSEGYSAMRQEQPWRPGDVGYEDTGMTSVNPASGHQTRMSTGNIDFGDPEQVSNIQEELKRWGALNTVGSNIGQPIDVDSIWGQNTEDAYRRYINERRGAAGMEGYTY